MIGRALGVGLANIANIFCPQVIVIGGGVSAAGELLLEPAREVMRRRALRPGRDEVRVEAAAFGAEAGMIGAAMLARERPSDVPSAAGPADGRGGGAAVSGRLVVCPTPIGNLEDVTLRVLAALREADVVACEDTRRTRVLLERYGVQATLVSYHEHNERERAAELVERMSRRRGRSRSSPTRGCRWSATRATCSCRAASRRGCRSRCCRGRRAALAALVASALPSDAWRFAGFLPRKRAALLEVLASPGDRRRVRVAAAGGGDAGRARRGRSARGRSRSAAS